jgi:hypothetical protein
MRASRAERLRGLAVLVTWMGFLAGSIAALLAIGHGQLSAPPLRLDALEAWATQQQAPTVLMVLVCRVALVLAAYLLLTTVGATLARLTRVAAAIRLADAVALPSVRRLVSSGCGVLLAAAPLAGSLAAAAPAWASPIAAATSAPGSPPVLRWLPPASPPASPRSTATAPTRARPTPPATVPATTSTSRPPPTVPGPAGIVVGPTATPAPRTTSTTAGAGPTEWTVAPGDSFWRITSEVLAAAWHRQPTDDEIIPYWEATIAENADRLAVPGEPDILFPAQVLVVPAPPPPP